MHYKIQHKAGRNFNHDFDVSFLNSEKVLIKTVKLEFKFNATTISDTPQFVLLVDTENDKNMHVYCIFIVNRPMYTHILKPNDKACY